MALENISDDGFIIEAKRNYAPEMVTAFIKLNGATVGAVANRTKVYDDDMNVAAEFDAKLTAKGCNKAAEFVNFCDAFNIPCSYTYKRKWICSNNVSGKKWR